MELEVRSGENYGGRFYRYSQPLEIGCYSITSDGKYRGDNHQMKYLAMPDKLTDLHLDLNVGYSDYVHIVEDTEDTFTAILRWILSHEEQIRNKFEDCSSKLDFVCFRGVLTALGYTIYENINDWMVYATKFRTVIYMDGIKTQQQADIYQKMQGGKGRLLSTWGFKFQQYMTSDEMNSRPNTSVPVNENEKYYAMTKGKLDDHRILFASKIVAVDPQHFRRDPTSILRYIGLKTSRIITDQWENWNFLRYKFLTWYLQSLFAGVPRVLCGYRDDDGIVRKLDHFNVKDMPKMAEGLWSSSTCVNFCSRILTFLKDCPMKDDPRVVYKIYFKPGSNITCEELSSDYQLLPDWYTEKVSVI